MNSLSPWSDGRADSKPLPVLTQIDPKKLKPHPLNSAIYGEDEDFSELISLISELGWIERLVVTPTGTIISGHRRSKAALELGLESVPVEVKEFPDETAELEALLLANASRIKTTEQKVREAQAWKKIEATRAKLRMIAAQNNTAGKAAVENFPQLVTAKGTTRDAIASRVGLGSGRTYSKAAKVVEHIDALVMVGDGEQAQALRQVLNEKSVDAAAKLLKRISISDNTNEDSLDKGSITTSNSGKDTAATEPQHSCWNCQHRGELIANHSFYCNRLGVLSLIDKTAELQGAECELWSYRSDYSEEAENKTQTNSTFTLILPAHLQQPIQDAARAAGVSVIDWATWVMEEALATCRTSCSAPQQTDKTEHQVSEYREPSHF